MRLPCLLESQEGLILVRYLRLRNIAFTHIPNETGHTPEAIRRAGRMKQQGTSKGFCDYVIAMPGVGMLFVELKRVHGSSTSPEQRQWIAVINQCPGSQAFIAKGAQAAIDWLESFAKPKVVGLKAAPFTLHSNQPNLNINIRPHDVF